MSRLIDADKLEPHEIYDDNGFTEVVYMDDIREMPTVEAEPIRRGQWNEEEDTLFRIYLSCHHPSLLGTDASLPTS